MDFFSLSSVLSESPPLFIGFSVILGLLIGSFLNVVIYRIPVMMQNAEDQYIRSVRNETQPEQPKFNLVTPRSCCPKCKHPISALENIPVISYLVLGGKCKGCKTPISPRYPLVELMTGGLLGLVSWQFGYGAVAFAAWVFTLALIALTFIDLDTQLLPDDITLPLLWIGLLFNLTQPHGFTDIASAVYGAVAGYLILWSIYWLFKLVTGKEGMGYGDFKLMAAIGAWFGWQMLPAILLLSSLVGSIIGIGMILFARHGRNVPIPFGPYLALGGIAALFFGSQLSHLYQ